jgi:hypothetical protein
VRTPERLFDAGHCGRHPDRLDDRWQEEEIFANRLSFYILAQSFLVVAAVTRLSRLTRRTVGFQSR